MLDTTTKRLLDVILIAWSAIWILVGVAVYNEVRGLRTLAGTVAVAGRSLDDTADALDAYAGVPFVGADLSKAARNLLEVAPDERHRAVGIERVGGVVERAACDGDGVGERL